MSPYAENTTVPAEKSRAEIERTLMRYGASQFMYGWDVAQGAVVQFRAKDRFIKFVLPMPRRDDPLFWRTDTGRTRAPQVAEQAWEQATRQRWRALALGHQGQAGGRRDRRL